MTIELIVTKIVDARYIDLNDFDGFYVPGRVNLKTVSPVPVSELPDADLIQFGHEYANGSAKLSLKTARYLFGHDPIIGEHIKVEARVANRNRGMRKGGFFYLYSLRKL